MYITIELLVKVEPHQAENDANEGEHPGSDIHDKRPSPRPPSSVYLPFKVKSSDKFPSIPGVNMNRLRQSGEDLHVNSSTSM